MGKQAIQQFWHDQTLPFVELRRVRDGSRICYEKHSHETFSIGAITGGASTCYNRGHRVGVSTGSVVVINPEDVHACNPVDERGWAYDMLFVDCDWLRNVQVETGTDAHGEFAMFAEIAARDPALYHQLVVLCETLLDRDVDALGKESALVAFFADLPGLLNGRLGMRTIGGAPGEIDNGKIQRAADYIRESCDQALRLADISAQAGVSPSWLVRGFSQKLGMTPHAWLINCRIQKARRALRRGEKIVDVALSCGFADQAHFQRVFKRLVAMTPRQYATGIAA
jgi:AraC-like DNA-binding protein